MKNVCPMLRIGKGMGWFLLSRQSDRKQAKHLTLYKRLYKRRILYNQFTSILQNNFCKSYWHSAENEYNRHCWKRNGTHCREGKAQRKRVTGRPGGHDVKAHFENCIVFGKMQGIKRHEKHMKSVKLQTENKHRTFTLALKRRAHSARATT